MAVAIVALAGGPSVRELPPAELYLQWEGPCRNAARNLSSVASCLPRPLSPRALDLIDVVSAVYLADLAVLRGRNEQWVREMHLTVAVREPELWQEVAEELTYLLYVLTRDSVRFAFCGAPSPAPALPHALRPFAADCVSLLSGGVDSLAGAAMLLKTGRRPLLLSHHSGNARLRAVQGQAAQTLQRLAPGASRRAGFSLQPGRGGGRRELFPPPGQREPSQRSRALLYAAVALAAAEAAGVQEAYLFDNGLMTMALPLSEARVGGLSTRSTHPKVLALVNRLAQSLQLGCSLSNPFNYLTKAEVIRDVLRPVLSPFAIQQTSSCWSAGRSSRQCGGCTACLVRRLAMLSAGLPDEAYELDVLARPQAYRGTDAYCNLVDLLGQASRFLDCTDEQLLSCYPELLDLPAAGVRPAEVLAMYRRHAAQVAALVRERFPAAAALMQGPASDG